MNIEADTSYLEHWMLSKTGRVKQDIIKCWSLLKRERPEEKNIHSVDPLDEEDETEDSPAVTQLKNTFKYFGNFKIVRNIMTLDSTLHRVCITQESKFIYGAGNNCKIKKRDFNIDTSVILSDKSS